MADEPNADAERLAQTDRYITETEQRVAEQEHLIQRLKAEGQDIAAAVRRLQSLQAMLRQMKDNREAVVRALGSIAAAKVSRV